MSYVVHCKKSSYDVYIGRPGPWGNPFELADYDDDREKVLELYAEWLISQPELVEKAKKELKGKVLGCWCKTEKHPDALCHGDILAEIANEQS